MAGISEVIQTMAAMVLFSIILLNANKAILLNNMHQAEGEAEKTAITLAQNIINEATVKAFDENESATEPEGFSDNCGTESGEDPDDPASFNDFDDYHGLTEEIDTAYGIFDLEVKVRYVKPDDDYNFDKGTPSNPGDTEFKKMRVTVTSDYNTEGIKLEYLRRYY